MVVQFNVYDGQNNMVRDSQPRHSRTDEIETLGKTWTKKDGSRLEFRGKLGWRCFSEYFYLFSIPFLLSFLATYLLARTTIVARW